MRSALKWLVRTVVAAIGLLVLLVVVYRFVPPVSTLMLGRWVTFRSVERVWMPLDRISPNLPAAVIASEDNGFCRNHGVDWGALRAVLKAGGAAGPSRGASTIHMQTAKNLFLWPARSAIRKAVEIPLALVLDVVWPKRRTLEVYLNIVEWGPGLYGAEAASRRYFDKSAANLSLHEAALLAAALPNPIRRNPAAPSGMHARLAARLMARVRIAGPALDCIGLATPPP